MGGGGGGRGFAPDLYGAVVGGGGEDGAIFGMGLWEGGLGRWAWAERVGRRGGPMRRTRLRLRAWELCQWMTRAHEERCTYPRSVSVSLCDSPSTSKILMVLSEEQVANLRP